MNQKIFTPILAQVVTVKQLKADLARLRAELDGRDQFQNLQE